ncbi:hypothetical protein FPQ18DRAFT_425285 [Pyronema domesticum]|nr:hypothetical protein FPQ18DRAFT_425285 [Pyronema domesticum]
MAKQVVVARRQHCREESAGALSHGERGRRIGSYCTSITTQRHHSVVAVSQLREWRGKRASVRRPSSRVCERAEHCMMAKQVVVARRQDCREESAGVLSRGERGRRIRSVSNKGGICAKERQVVFPEGRSVVSRAPVHCCWKARPLHQIVYGDEGANGALLRAIGQSLRKSGTPRGGEASGVPRREECMEQSASALLLEKRGRRIGW